MPCVIYEPIQVPIVAPSASHLHLSQEMVPGEVKLESSPEKRQEVGGEHKEGKSPELSSAEADKVKEVESAPEPLQSGTKEEVECVGEVGEEPQKAVVQAMIEVPVEVVLMEILEVPVEVFIAQMGPDSIREPTLQVPVDIHLNKSANLPAEIVMKERLSEKQIPAVEEETEALRKSSSVKS